jgi:hypothetical protein
MGKLKNLFVVASEKTEAIHGRKTCCVCGETKPIKGFPLRKDSPDKHTYYCRTCGNAMSRKSYKLHRRQRIAETVLWNKLHPEQYRTNLKKYQSKPETKEKIRPKQRIYSALYRIRHREVYLKNHREQQRRYRKKHLV